MLKSTLSATTARSSACRDGSASARPRLLAPSRKGWVAIRRVCTSYPASATARLARLRAASAACGPSVSVGLRRLIPAVMVRMRKPGPAASRAGLRHPVRASGVSAAAPSIASTSRRETSLIWETNAPAPGSAPRVPRLRKGYRFAHLLRERRVALHELGIEPVVQAEHVV